jgi:hypothetical protein
MKRIFADERVEFRPSITRSSIPLAITAVVVPLATGVLCWLGLIQWWALGTAMAGAVLVFGISFLMPFLQTVVVRHGEISGPSGYGVNTLRLEKIDPARTFMDETGQAILVDDLGSVLVLAPIMLSAEEVREAVTLFGLDPGAIARKKMPV